MDRVRFSRQLLVREWGVSSQQKLHDASILVIGAGGLGCSVILHLAAGGVGRLGIVDFDVIERTNLHRQVLYGEADVGALKAERAREMALQRNPALSCEAYVRRFGGEAGLRLIVEGGYDVVVDCSDNVATRYAVSDACVLAARPLVSAAASGVDGQLSVLNALRFGGGGDGEAGDAAAERGPCYRCLHPSPPAQAGRCGDVGVLGIVPGLIGCMQALEVLKLVGGVGETLDGRLCVVDALYGTYRSVGPVRRRAECIACGVSDDSTCSDDGGAEGGVRFSMAASEAWAAARGLGVCLADELPARRRTVLATAELPRECITTCTALAARLHEEQESGGRSSSSAAASAAAAAATPLPLHRRRHLLILDVRSAAQFAICALPGSRNIPLAELASRMDEVRGVEAERICVICRRGIDSVRAARLLLDAGCTAAVQHVEGGLTEWSRVVDPGFAMY